MSGGGGTNTVSQTTVPSWLQPYYTSALQTGQQLTSGAGPSYYPGNQVAPLNSLQEQALSTAQQGVPMAEQAYNVAQTGVPMAEQAYGVAQQGVPMAEQAYGVAQTGVPMAQQGYGQAQQDYQPTNAGVSSIMNSASQPNASDSAQQANMFETSGALLNPSSNPYLQQTFQQGANAVQNQLSTEFAGSGRNIIGSLPVQSDEMNNLATQLYGGQYDTGLNTMTQASALAPSIDAGTYQPGQQLLNASASALNNNASVLNAGNNVLNAGNNLANSGNNVLAAGNNLASSGNNILAAGNNLATSGNNVLNAGNNELSAGAGLQGQTQNLINQNVNAYNYQQQMPYNQLSYMSGLLGSDGSGFKSSSGSTTGTSNPWSTAIGGGLLANSLVGSGALSSLINLIPSGVAGGSIDGLLGAGTMDAAASAIPLAL